MSTKSRSIAAIAALGFVAASLVGCAQLAAKAQPNAIADTSLLAFATEVSLPFEYVSFEQLADKASAIVVVKPTGKSKTVPLPRKHGGDVATALIPFIEVKVQQVLGGTLSADTILLVIPGFEPWADSVEVLEDGTYLVFIAPAMYAANDPIGGYVAVGGSRGVYIAADDSEIFVPVDLSNSQLPGVISLRKTLLPQIMNTEEELLNFGR